MHLTLLIFDWMMPYERMGALLSEDAQDFINREKAKLKKEQCGPEGEQCRTEGEQCCPEGEQPVVCGDESDAETETDVESDCEKEEEIQLDDPAPDHQTSTTTISSSNSMAQTVASDLTSHVSPPRPSPHQVSSIFSAHAKNPNTDEEVQVNPKHPDEAVHPKISHFHPPFLIIDCRRKDEYIESHIHGVIFFFSFLFFFLCIILTSTRLCMSTTCHQKDL